MSRNPNLTNDSGLVSRSLTADSADVRRSRSSAAPLIRGDRNGTAEGTGIVPAGLAHGRTSDRENGPVEEAVIDEVLDLLAAAIWADFKGRNLSHGQVPEGNQP